MKKIIITLIFCTTLSSFAQEKVTQKLEDFVELKIFNGLHVNLIKSSKQKIEITGEKSEAVYIKNRKGVLKIGLKIKSLFDSKSVKIDIYYNKDIGELDVNQGAVIVSKDVFAQTQLEVSSQEGAYIKLKVVVDYLKVKAITGGNIQLKGKTKSQNVEISTGSNYEGFDLISDQTSISVSTGAEAKIHVTDVLDAKVKLGGTIEYMGKPKSVKTAKVLGGSIFAKSDK